jgi:hypothetical protein
LLRQPGKVAAKGSCVARICTFAILAPAGSWSGRANQQVEQGGRLPYRSTEAIQGRFLSSTSSV